MSTTSELDSIRAKMVLEELARREALVNLIQTKSRSPARQLVFMLALMAFVVAATWLPWDGWLASHPQAMHQIIGFGVAIGTFGVFGAMVIACRLGALIKLLDQVGMFSKFVEAASDAGKMTP